ncbi:hypothetical protein QE109_04655 [Fusibacter bizertensis]|uniref:Kinase n=1 Tax=Fusibacter bizertensis TaxID=1488331 RepID=A0ABT6NAJ5_9FIRM|nr:hypothetical protein [Fusibacter bizertensis]MDH8677424.1 hypothetical protein [Fusibacter bizertensis]
MFNKALYYPWIEINDKGWLKTSALYWNEISTIVPKSYGNLYYDYESSLLKDEGLLKACVVDSRTTSSPFFRDKIIEYFDKYENHYQSLLKNQSKERYQNRIYWEKVDPKMHSFIQARLRNYNDEYFMADNHFADFYMTLLASDIAKRRGLNLITDTPILNQIGSEIHFDSNVNRTRHNYYPRRTAYLSDDISRLSESLLAKISFQHVGITPDTDMKKIIKFRRKYSDYLSKYRMEMKSLVQMLNVEDFETIEALNSAIEMIVKDRIKVSLSDIEKSLKSENIKLLIAPISISGIIGASTAFSLNPFGAAGAAGVAIAAQAYVRRTKRNEILRDNSYAYLQLIEEKL